MDEVQKKAPPPLPPKKYAMQSTSVEAKPQDEVITGAHLAIAGFLRSLKHPHLAKRLMSTLLWMSLAYIGVSLFTHYVLLLPFRLVMLVTSDDSRIQGVMEQIEQVGHRVPLILLQGVQYFYPQALDRSFLEGALFLQPDLHVRLSHRPYQRQLWVEFKDFCQRSWKRARYSLIILLLSPLPLVGPLVLPAVGFILASRSFGRPIALGLAIASIIPWTRPLAHLLLEIVQDARQLGRELLEPFFCREGWTPKEQRAWLRRWGWRMLGYSLVYVAWVRFPWVGLSGYLAGQTALSVLVVSMPLPEMESRPKSS